MGANKGLPRPALAALLVLTLLAAGCGGGEPPEQDEPPEVGIVQLQTQPVALFTTLPGRTSAYRVAQVRPQVGGIVQKRSFEEGAEVKAGQVLYRIDPKPYRAAYDSAKADLAKARAAVTSVRQRAQRFRDLLADHAVSQQEYDDAKATLQQRIAEVAVAEAALKTARINLDYTTVESPIGGRIGQSFITEGALVTANQADKLAQVTQLAPIYVDIPRSSEQVLRLKREFEQGRLQKAGPKQAKVKLLMEDGSEYAHAGKLQFSGVTVDRGTGSVTLRAIVPNPDHDLLPGMFVRARLSEGVKDNALLVPQQGVTHNRKGEPTALVVGKDNKLERRQLETDRAIGAFWLVTGGLTAGDRVLVTGRQGVEAGDKVKPMPADIPNKPSGDAAGSGPGGRPEPQSAQEGDAPAEPDAADHG